MIALLVSLATAAPLQLTHTGRLLDATGSPLGQTHDVTLSLYTSSTGGTALWSEVQPGLAFDNGYFITSLGSDTVNNALTDAVFASPTLFLGVAVDGGTELTPRHQIASVPWAVQARNLAGGTVDATSISIDGNVVIDSSGTVVAPSAGGLDSLSCNVDQIAVFDGSSWGCADADNGAVDWSAITGIPSDIADGDDDTIVTTLDWTSITGIPSDIADGDDDTIVTTLDWTSLTSIPSDIADGDDDTLPGLPCADGDVPLYAVGAWSCTALPIDTDTDTTLTEAEVEAFIENGDLNLGGALTTVGDVGVGEPSPDVTLDVNGGIQIGDFATCDAAREGTLRYNSSRLELCTGTAWSVLATARDGSTQANAGLTCLEILTSNPSATDGQYWIDPNGGATTDAFRITCDMSGGGYTRLSLSGGRITMSGAAASADCSPYAGYGTNQYLGSGHRSGCSGSEVVVTWHDDSDNPIADSQIAAMNGFGMTSTPTGNWIQDPDGTTDNLMFCWDDTVLRDHTWAPKSGPSMSCYQDNNSVTTQIFNQWSASTGGDDNAQNWYLERYWHFRE